MWDHARRAPSARTEPFHGLGFKRSSAGRFRLAPSGSGFPESYGSGHSRNGRSGGSCTSKCVIISPSLTSTKSLSLPPSPS